MAQTSDIDGMSFEQAMKELEAIVRRMESASGDLEASIKDYVRGTALQQHCQKKLADAKLRIETIIKEQSGQALALAPLDAPAS